ncbi:hypothetical protein C8Q70DRAFT_1114275 [Cubamyces menziesii]|nr:hypothetical protein C8Q70DRAFT_1114275 [Cubamyces menziesii]
MCSRDAPDQNGRESQRGRSLKGVGESHGREQGLRQTASTTKINGGAEPVQNQNGAVQHPPGSAAIFGIAVLENPRLTDMNKPRTITFDATFWLGVDLMPLTACFRYFNKDNLEIPEQGTFAVMATVAQPAEDAELGAAVLYTDYDLIGDIIWMVGTPDANAHQLPVMIINGPTHDINRTAATFKVNAAQYVQQLKDSNPGRLEVDVQIPDSGRFKNGKKPLPPTEGSNAAVTGVLSSVHRASGTMAAERFEVTLENVAYFPRSHTSLPIHNPATPPSGSKRKLAFQDVPSTPLNPGKRRATSEK